MRRKLTHYAALLTLVLCIAGIGMWVRGYWRIDRVAYQFVSPEKTSTANWEVQWGPPGRISIGRMKWAGVSDVNPRNAGWQLYSYPPSGFSPAPYTPPSLVERLGFSVYHTSKPSATRSAPNRWFTLTVVTMPIWVPVILTAMLPALMVLRCVRTLRRRRRGNCCVRCGYDLRATPDRCPECGAVPEPPHNPPMQRTGAAV